jgi:hypothetical protein
LELVLVKRAQMGLLLEGARLQPCHECWEIKAALAAEGLTVDLFRVSLGYPESRATNSTAP